MVATLGVLGCSSSLHEKSLTIACAASVQYAMAELVEQFEKESNIPCQIIVGSSGKLSAQIMNGAPFDVFVSADTDYPNRLYEQDLCVAPPQVYGGGQVVLWTMAINGTPSLDDLTDRDIQKIAIANPKLAPYGRAAEVILQQHDLLEQVQSKLVFGESIAQVNQFVTTGVADVGFTSLSTVRSPELRNKGSWSSPPGAHRLSLPQAMVILKSSKVPDKAEKFRQFMVSHRAREILKQHGYLLDNDLPADKGRVPLTN